MLSLETVGTWTSASVAVTIGADTDTYTHTSGSPSAYHLATSFIAWAEDGARAWHGTVFFVLSWSKGTNGGAVISITCHGSAATYVPNVDWQTLMLHSSETTGDGDAWSGSDGAAGTSAPHRAVNHGFWSVRRALLFSGDSGNASASQAIRPFVPGLAGQAPVVTTFGDVLDAARLTEIAATASNPRRLNVYRARDSRWIELSAGAFTVQAIAPKVFRLSVDVAGDTL